MFEGETWAASGMNISENRRYLHHSLVLKLLNLDVDVTRSSLRAYVNVMTLR